MYFLDSPIRRSSKFDLVGHTPDNQLFSRKTISRQLVLYKLAPIDIAQVNINYFELLIHPPLQP